jgi:phosphoglycerate dehydrogenase-like enzyme
VRIENSRKTDHLFVITPERYAAALRRHPWAAARVEATLGWDFEDTAALRRADVLVSWKFPRDRLAVLAPRLRWIHCIGAGVDHLLPLDWLPAGVTLTNNSGVHVPKAAEYACMAILALNNRLPVHVTNQREARWARTFVSRVGGKTLAVIGVGSLGAAAAERARAFGMRVLGIRRSGRAHRAVDEMFRPAELHEVLPRADVVLVTAPLTSETTGMLGRKELDLLKPSAGLVNMSRGALVDQEALADKLRRNELAGAILDVFVPEPLPADSPLWRTPNLIITPHVSSDDSEEYAHRTLGLLFTNLRRHVEGKTLGNVVDVARQY